MRRLALLSLLALAAVAVAQGFRTRPDNVVVRPDDVMNTYHYGPYNATTGSLFDAGYSTNSLGVSAYPASVEGAEALIAAECENRMRAYGVNNAQSNVFSIGDDTSARTVTSVLYQAAALDAGLPVSVSQIVTTRTYWRPLAGGDAGVQWWQASASNSATVALSLFYSQASGPNPGRVMGTMNVNRPNGSAASTGDGDFWAPGYYCIVPWSSASYGLGHVWLRLNRVFEPR